MAGAQRGLYYLGGESLRAAVALGHWALGLMAVAWLPTHIWLGRRGWRRRQAPRPD